MAGCVDDLECAARRLESLSAPGQVTSFERGNKRRTYLTLS